MQLYINIFSVKYANCKVQINHMQTLKWEKTLKKRPYMSQNHQSSSFKMSRETFTPNIMPAKFGNTSSLTILKNLQLELQDKALRINFLADMAPLRAIYIKIQKY